MLIIILNLWVLLCRAFRPEVDISWDFSLGLDGWGNATAEEMHMALKVEGDELRGSITGLFPTIDSPPLFIDISRRHYCVIRMRYSGGASKGQLLVRSGPSLMDTSLMDYGLQYWQARTPSVAISDSGSFSGNIAANVFDNNPHTYWQSTISAGAFIVVDLGDTRAITELLIQSLGNVTSPKTCVLQRSVTSGVGPFTTATTFILDDTSDPQFISGFSAAARYWKLFFIDNYGGSSIGIREISLTGFDESVSVVPFDLDNTDVHKNYYLPLFSNLAGAVTRLRLQLSDFSSVKVSKSSLSQKSIQKGVVYKEGFAFDYIRIVRAPEIWRVRGCIDVYFESVNMQSPLYNVTTKIDLLNGHLPVFSYDKNTRNEQYATTYDCPLSGYVNITIDGINFGDNARVYIGGNECMNLEYKYDPVAGQHVETIVCLLPASLAPGSAVFRVQNGVLPGLYTESKSIFAYRRAPPVPLPPIVTNIAATSVDLVWSPPGDVFDNLAVTGYKIIWYEPQLSNLVNNITVTNITTTSIRGLIPGKEYVFSIAAVCEGAYPERASTWPTDLYGRRDLSSINSFLGGFSDFTNITATLDFDFDFSFFNANNTLNHSSLASTVDTLGPTGLFGGEGHYGLIMVGNANLQNCNESATCCDGYDARQGIKSCHLGKSVGMVDLSNLLAYDYVIDGVTRRQVPSNLPYSNGGPPEKIVLSVSDLLAKKTIKKPTSPCGPALRLTASRARDSGSMWYPRKVNVGEGFDTTFSFEISNPSQVCNVMDDVSTYCRSRGADGLAFVIQNISPVALGNAGSGMGYEGIENSLAVEFDTFFNYDNLDSYENHVSVLTMGWRYNISANHSYALGTSTGIADLTDGPHYVRIRYDPNFDEVAAQHPSFQINGHTSWFFENADYPFGGQGDWGTGFGLLYVYVDDLYAPVLTVPLNLQDTLQLEDGRMYVGLTAATGENHWQVHDILSWRFTSLHIDRLYQAPLIVNNAGDYHCANEEECVHYPDYDHYLRRNNLATPPV